MGFNQRKMEARRAEAAEEEAAARRATEARCPACRTTQAVDLRTLDRHPWSALTGLIRALSCRPHAPSAELVCLSDKSIADEMREQHTRRILGNNSRGRLRCSPRAPEAEYSKLLSVAAVVSLSYSRMTFTSHIEIGTPAATTSQRHQPLSKTVRMTTTERNITTPAPALNLFIAAP
jgi:hypothetical protein